MLVPVESAQAISQAPLPSPSSYGEMVLISLAMVAVVGVGALVVTRSLGAWRGAARGGLLEVVARLPLEPRRSLYVVRVAERTLLLGTSEMGLSMLSELGELPRGAPSASPSGTFAALVREARERWRERKGGGDAAALALGADARRDAGEARAAGSLVAQTVAPAVEVDAGRARAGEPDARGARDASGAGGAGRGDGAG